MADILEEKETFTIKAAAEATGLTHDTLRYYEKYGIIDWVSREPGGRRQYSGADIEWLKFVVCLKSTGMPLERIKDYKELMIRGDETAEERKSLLTDHRDSLMGKLEEIKEALQRINWKIEYYDEIIRKQGF